MLENYKSGITLQQRADVQNRAAKVGGICGTITAIEIFNFFNIKLSDQEIKEGILDSKRGTNQVNMVLFMSKYLDITYCVNHDIKKEIENGPSETLSISNHTEFVKLLNKENINFMITPDLKDIIKLLNTEDSLAQFVFHEPEDEMTHYGLLCNVKNDLLEFTQRRRQIGEPDVKIDKFYTWWDKKDNSEMDPQQLVLIYRLKKK